MAEEAVAAVRDALERTLESASARFEMSTAVPRAREAPHGLSATVREYGLFLSFLTGLDWLVMRFTKFGRRMRREMHDEWRSGEGEGVVDFSAWRAATDYGEFATLEADGKRWSGRSGRPVSTLEADRPHPLGPLWLLNVVRGTSDARAEAEDVGAGLPCRRFEVTADLATASASSPADVAVPAVAGFRDLAHLQLHVATALPPHSMATSTGSARSARRTDRP